MTPQEQAGFIPSLEREPTVEEQKIIDSRGLKASTERMRRFLSGVEVASEIWPDGDHINEIGMGGDCIAVTKAYVAEHQAEDDELCDEGWLNEHKFKIIDDGCYRLEICPSGLHVTVTVDREGGAKTLSIGWVTSSYGASKIGLVYLLEDQPTKGRVRKLLEALS